jgi:hypothetical protein
MYRGKQQITAETRTSRPIMSLKDRQSGSDAIPPGAKLVWSETEGKLIVRVPKASGPATPAHQPSASFTIIDRVLGVPAR